MENQWVLHVREAGQIHAHFTKALKPNLLNSFLRSLTPEKVLQAYNLILSSSGPHDHFTYNYAVRACSLLRATRKGREIHARVLKSGHHSDLFIRSSLISFYSAAADAASARRIFAGISRHDVASWTSIIGALARNGCEEDALLAFASMDAGPNPLTLVSVLSACSRAKALKLGKSVHGYACRRFGGHCGNVILENATLDMYMSCGAPVDASHLFGEMPDRDVVSWTTMVSGYAHNSIPGRAIEAFCDMLLDGVVAPNEATLVSVLRACASKGALSIGKWVHSCSYRSHIGGGLLGNALINMYAKCGDAGMALKVFDKHPCKDLVSWGTIMGGMAMNGRAKEALQLFSLMLCHGVQPDISAFVALLSACSHAGLVNQGVLVFKAMVEVYKIAPQKEHYACMVDMYGRAGRLKEAEEFFRSIPVEPDSHMWGSLIGAWKNHGGDAAACEQVRKKVLGGELVVGAGAYALLSNALAIAGRWEESNNVREFMRAMGIRKAAGCSRIDMLNV